MRMRTISVTLIIYLRLINSSISLQLNRFFSTGFASRWRDDKVGVSKSRLCMLRRSGRPESTVVILYHKPPNVVTSHSRNDAAPASSGERTRKTVYDDVFTLDGYLGDRKGSFADVTGIRSKLHSIGRLDADTSGLLLLTNDGGLVHHVTNPESKLAGGCASKTYEAVIMGIHDNNSTFFQRIREVGVDIGAKYGGMTAPAENLTVLGHPTIKSTLVSLTITEGKNRQVRRMFHAMNSGVMRLKRTNIGATLNLDGVAEGKWRILTDDEVAESLGWIPRVIGVDPSLTRRPRKAKKSGVSQ